MVRPATTRSSDVQTYLDQLCQVDASMTRVDALSQAFWAMVRERRGEDLEAWLAEATHRGSEALARFAPGLQDALMAIKAGLTLEWSHGTTAGQIHRLKLLKRPGYGRAGLALLRQRVLPAAEGRRAAHHLGRSPHILDPRATCRGRQHTGDPRDDAS
jgi:transposase